MNPVHLRQADKVEITALLDNTTDLLSENTAMVKRLRGMPPSAPWPSTDSPT